MFCLTYMFCLTHVDGLVSRCIRGIRRVFYLICVLLGSKREKKDATSDSAWSMFSRTGFKADVGQTEVCGPDVGICLSSIFNVPSQRCNNTAPVKPSKVSNDVHHWCCISDNLWKQSGWTHLPSHLCGVPPRGTQDHHRASLWDAAPPNLNFKPVLVQLNRQFWGICMNSHF